MAKKSKADQSSASTDASTDVGTDVGTDASTDASTGVGTGEALATPLSGEARVEMLGRVSESLPESERAGFVAFVDAQCGGTERPGAPVSFDQAVELLGEYMAERLAFLAQRVSEREDAAAGSLVDIVLDAVRARCAEALALPCITGEMADASPAAGLDEMTADELVALVESIGDPVARIQALKQPVNRAADEVRALAVDPVRLVNEALDNIRRHHEHAYRYWMRRKTLAEAMLAKRAGVAAG